MNSTINLGNHPNLKIMSHEIYRTNTKALLSDIQKGNKHTKRKYTKAQIPNTNTITHSYEYIISYHIMLNEIYLQIVTLQ